MKNDYKTFIASKRIAMPVHGFDIDESSINESLFPWQRRVVKWALRQGRAALFEECGLGKTLQQLEWAAHVHRHTGKPVVVHTPVGVRSQTRDEASKFKIECSIAVVDEPSEIIDGINLINYEKLHKFDSRIWGGVVLDESSILKSYTGSTKRELCERYKQTPYKLACTATPSPNDQMELGNHSEFLGIMPSNEMLSRWFINDTMKAGGYRLRQHAVKDYWKWVSSWAVCLSRPSDIGGSDEGYILPALNVIRHTVATDVEYKSSTQLIPTSMVSATTIHEEKRLTLQSRSKKAAELAYAANGPVVIWCDTDYEADALVKHIPDAVEVRGSDRDKVKEAKLKAFADGEFTKIITKPTVAGFGMNWQHADTVIFAGITFSFEQYYQAVRRCWRFGQTKPVNVNIILSDSDLSVEQAIARKESDHKLMQTGMADAMRESSLEQLGLAKKLTNYQPSKRFKLPTFMKGR